MALQYVSSDEKDFSGGIDARSSENQISPSFVKELLNADVVEKRVRKRPGYQGLGGNVPVRVTKLEYRATGNKVCFTLDTAISLTEAVVDLAAVNSSPLVVYGLLSSSATAEGPFNKTTNVGKYYNSFEVMSKKLFTTAGSSVVIPVDEHGITSTDMFAAMVTSTSFSSRSYNTAIPHELSIDNSNYDLTVQYTNNTTADESGYVFYKQRTAAAGEVYIHTETVTPAAYETITTLSIPATTHNLNNYNIIAQVQQVVGSNTQVVIPLTTKIAANGDVTVEVQNNQPPTNPPGPGPTQFRVILSATEVTNQVTGNVDAGGEETVVLTNLESPWVFYGIYLEEEDPLVPGTVCQRLVYPDKVEYDDEDKSLTLTFTNYSPDPLKFNIFYEYGFLRSNTLCVTDAAATVNGVDTRPQITLWGLDHANIYGENAGGRAGWVNHIDSYTSAGEQRMLCGLGGNLFANYGYAEGYSTSLAYGTEYKYPLLYPRLQARTSGARILGPVFWDTGEEPELTRGYITGDESGTHWARVTAVLYDTTQSNWTKYTLTVPGKALKKANGTTETNINSIISSVSGLEDQLTIQNMSYKRHNGVFTIKKVEDGPGDLIYVWVQNNNNSADYNDSGTQGEAGVFTDKIVTTSSSPFLAGDRLSNAAFHSIVSLAVSSSGTSTVISGIVDKIQVAGGIITVGTRTSSVVPLREGSPNNTPSSKNLVQGDMLAYTGTEDERLIRVLSVNGSADQTASIVGNGTEATVTISSTTYLAPGRKVLFYAAGVYTGVQTVSTILDNQKFTFESSETVTVSGATLVGYTAELDEELEWGDSLGDDNSFVAPSRWIPVEAPTDAITATPNTYTRYFDTENYGSQSFLRSTTVVDNMYLTNYQDEVYKFDGVNNYRAGLFPWQPGLFLSQDGSATATIANNNVQIQWKANPSDLDRAAGRLSLEASELKAIKVGAAVRLEGSSQIYTVKDYNTETGTHYILFDRSLDSSVTSTSGTGKITQVLIRRYYFRLDAIDANNNIIGSAMTGYQDHIVEVVGSVAIHIKLVGLPVWDVYDYDRLFVSIYATLSNTAGPFYKLAQVPMSFENGNGYIVYTDSISDENLTDPDKLAVLTGGEIGLAWQEPLRSKYITSIDNRLVQANLKDYPQLDIQIEADGSVVDSNYSGKTFTFKRDDSVNTGTGTRMIDYATYEFVTSTTTVTKVQHNGNGTFTCFTTNTDGLDTNKWVYLTFAAPSTLPPYSNAFTTAATDSVSSNTHKFVVGDQVRFTGTLPPELSSSATYYVVNVPNANSFKVSTQLGGSAITFTAAPAGNGTVFREGNNLTYSGWWQVASKVTNTSFTINYSGPAQSFGSVPNRYAVASDAANIPVLLGTDGNLGMRSALFEVSATFSAATRLAMAINASMRVTDTALVPGFKAWMTARGGNDTGQPGRLIVRHPRADTDTLSVVLPSSIPSNYSIFVNGLKYSAGSMAKAITRVYPSRLTLSYQKYPEIVDSPTAILDTESSSAIDVNSADGQEITGIIPFFGETAFTAAQQEAMLVVFKTNSIYLIDVAKKAAGEPCVQKIETEGLGCTAPYSIARTKKGIIFANESGIYCLRRDQSIQYLGRYMERNWVNRVNRDLLEICQGHHYALGRSYKLSVPLLGETQCSEVYVYNHTGEDYNQNQLGAWGRYDNHPATGWANLGSDAFFGATHGRVYSIRRQGTETDFRDDNMPIAFQLDTRAMDFGNSGIRKVLDSIIIDYRVPVESTGTAVLYAADTQQEYRGSTPFTIEKSNQNTGLDDPINRDIQTIRHDTDRRRGNYFQVRVTNSSKDEGLEVAGMSFRVGGLTDKGTKQARQTRK